MAKRRSLFFYRSSFFGLTQEYRVNLFRTIHEIVFYGRGGYDYDTIYNMPLWLRRVTHQLIQESLSAENVAQNKALGKVGGGNSTTLDWANPDKSKITAPGYISKASKK